MSPVVTIARALSELDGMQSTFDLLLPLLLLFSRNDEETEEKRRAAAAERRVQQQPRPYKYTQYCILDEDLNSSTVV